MTAALVGALWLTSGLLLLSLVAIAWPAEEDSPPNLAVTVAISVAVVLTLVMAML